jgi:uncharacterized membrane protein YhaH (DUF805 family)
MLFFFLLILGISIWLGALIARKAGFSGWWGVTQVIPIVNLIMIWVFAFVEWGEPRPPAGKKEEKIISAWD